jgi:hypothetical protein
LKREALIRPLVALWLVLGVEVVLVVMWRH